MCPKPPRDKYEIDGVIELDTVYSYDTSSPAEILVSTGGIVCDNIWLDYKPGSMTDTLKHEIGHHLGLEHHYDEDHLMYGLDYILPFDDKEYKIPQRESVFYSIPCL